jgi:hypothetical protein
MTSILVVAPRDHMDAMIEVGAAEAADEKDFGCLSAHGHCRLRGHLVEAHFWTMNLCVENPVT